ncbi:helix-turn-helix domain-containing protein [Aquimarina aggregata]|nr:helix-turn-helix domain-containing protein [Aquimarina aggregata]
MSILPQYILAYISGISLAVYFIYYIYKEFNISPFKNLFFRVKPLLFTLSGAFIVLFLIPYYIYENIQLSRVLFLSIPLVIASAFLIKVGNILITLYIKDKGENSTMYKYRIISSYIGLFTLSLLPVMLVFANYQCLKVSVLNFGFAAMMITYIIDFISKAQKETIILSQISKKTAAINPEILIADEIIKDIVEKLNLFENRHEYLKAKITITILAKRFGTNSKYISQIVNKQKGKSFTQYINDLRITYLKDRLKDDKKFRNYTLKAIATEIGYTSAEGFARAFYKKEHIKLSEYIKKITDNE